MGDKAHHPTHEKIDPELSAAEAGRSGQAVRVDPAVVLGIALSGALGAFCRYAVGVALPAAPGTFPRSTFVINIVGAAAIGVVVTVLRARVPNSRFARPVLVTGFLGGFTTFSTFAVDADSLVRSGDDLSAAAYLCASVFVGLTATVLGIAGTRFVLRARLAPEGRA